MYEDVVMTTITATNTITKVHMMVTPVSTVVVRMVTITIAETMTNVVGTEAGVLTETLGQHHEWIIVMVTLTNQLAPPGVKDTGTIAIAADTTMIAVAPGVRTIAMKERGATVDTDNQSVVRMTAEVGTATEAAALA
jgi:hypothetical protein